DTPLSQRVREADARAAKKDADDDEEEEPGDDEQEALGAALEVPEKIAVTATGPHALLRNVSTLELETDYKAQEWSLRMPYDNFVLTLARDSNGAGALCEQRVGAGSVLLCAGGSLFTSRALVNADNAQLFANIVSLRMADDGGGL